MDRKIIYLYIWRVVIDLYKKAKENTFILKRFGDVLLCPHTELEGAFFMLQIVSSALLCPHTELEGAFFMLQTVSSALLCPHTEKGYFLRYKQLGVHCYVHIQS